jgi:hypothetical protein
MADIKLVNYAKSSGNKRGLFGKKKSDNGFIEWIFETYKDSLQINKLEGGKKYTEFMNSMKQDSFPLSSMYRIQDIHRLVYGFPMRKAGYAAGVFRISLPNDKSDTELTGVNIGYCLWKKNIDGYAMKTEVYNKPTKTDVICVAEYSKPEYMCISPTYDSKDGEYHHNILWYDSFDSNYDKLTDIISELELIILNNIRDGNIEIKVDFYPSDVQYEEHGPMQFVDDNRLGIKSLVAYFISIYLHGHTFYQVHMVHTQIELFKGLYKIFKPFCIKYLLDYETRTKMNIFVTGRTGTSHNTQCGHKLIPLTIKETQSIDNINYGPWREIYITSRATDLIVNNVTQGVPIYGDWAYFNGLDNQFLSNESMKEKYINSTKSIAMRESLNATRNLAGNIKDTNEELVRLDKYMYDSIDHIQENIQLSDVVLCMVVEHCGFSMGSQYNYIINNPLILDERLKNSFSNKHYQIKTLFELCYTANALHLKSGIIHGDLHINNMTLLEGAYSSDVLDLKGKIAHKGYRIKNPTIAYVTGDQGELDTFLFPFDGLTPTIIDYSRSIIGESVRSDISDKYGGPFAEGFYRSQVNRVLRLFNKYLPNFTQTHQTTIKGLIYSNFDDMFKLLTCVDFMSIGRNMSLYWRQCSEHKKSGKNVREIPVAKEGIAMGRSIEKIALEHMMMGLSELIGSKGKTTKQIEFVGPKLFHKVFNNYSYTEWSRNTGDYPWSFKDIKLTDIRSMAAPMKYSLSNYDKFPPYYRMEEINKKLFELPVDVVSNGRGFLPYIESKRSNNYLEVIIEEVRRDSSLKPAADSSSWI